MLIQCPMSMNRLRGDRMDSSSLHGRLGASVNVPPNERSFIMNDDSSVYPGDHQTGGLTCVN